MKIIPEHYAVIENHINQLSKLVDMSKAWQSYKDSGLSFRRFCFDCSYAKINGQSLNRFICDNIYSYANDTHLFTALNAAVSKLVIQ